LHVEGLFDSFSAFVLLLHECFKSSNPLGDEELLLDSGLVTVSNEVFTILHGLTLFAKVVFPWAEIIFLFVTRLDHQLE
jgi:hypothetical protein